MAASSPKPNSSKRTNKGRGPTPSVIDATQAAIQHAVINAPINRVIAQATKGKGVMLPAQDAAIVAQVLIANSAEIGALRGIRDEAFRLLDEADIDRPTTEASQDTPEAETAAMRAGRAAIAEDEAGAKPKGQVIKVGTAFEKASGKGMAS